MTTQIDLFEHVAGAYAQPASGRLSNNELYRIAAGRAGVEPTTLEEKQPIGKEGVPRSKLKRAIRWHQQTLRRLGLIERVQDATAVWEMTEAGRSKLRQIRQGIAVLGFSTDLGVAIWGSCTRVFDQWDEPIYLGLCSPPYPLRQPRAYGNPSLDDYIDFICRTVEPVVRNLVPGGNVVLSLGDVFEPNSPAKSTYIEELTIAFRKRFGLHFMNRIVWASNKPPGPVQWASKKRMQLNEGHEYLVWFCSAPNICIANNQRVLEPHSEAQKKLIAKGGEQRTSINGDGAYRIRNGSYGRETAGKIPTTVWKISNHCPSQREYKRRARDIGLVPHGAPMPLELARKAVRFFTDVDQLVVDWMGGSMTTALACQREGRRWASCDTGFDYVRGGAERFREEPGFELFLDV